MAANCILSIHSNSTPTSLFPLTPSNSLQIPSSSFLKIRDNTKFNNGVFTTTIGMRRRKGGIVCGFLPVDPWAPTIDSQSIASQLFAFSLFPYLGFLYFITKSKSAPKLTVFGFYFLLAFVGATSRNVIEKARKLKLRTRDRVQLDLCIGNPPRSRLNMNVKQSESHKATIDEVQLRALFRKHDINGDGHLNKEELKEAFRRLGSFMPSWRADRAIYYTDIDIDGVINEEEIDHLVAYAVDYGYTLD
uniref:EF-hand domain-containing protein n=1 Tax=Chenopodium quinoa TaxID=63459 RepID=A0A803LWG8_CHEQI